MRDVLTEPAHFLAEWYRPELTDQSVDAMVSELDAAAALLNTRGFFVQLLVTLSVPVDEVLYGVFVADSPDLVNETCQRAGIPPQRLTPDVGARIQRELRAAIGVAAEPEPTLP